MVTVLDHHPQRQCSTEVQMQEHKKLMHVRLPTGLIATADGGPAAIADLVLATDESPLRQSAFELPQHLLRHPLLLPLKAFCRPRQFQVQVQNDDVKVTAWQRKPVRLRAQAWVEAHVVAW